MDETGDETDQRADVPDQRDATNVQAMGSWEAVITDMEATASGYEEQGWETLQCHPGDVTVLTEGERVGLDVLIPDNEFEELTTLLSGVAFDESEVFTATEGDLVFVLVAMKDETAETAVLFPAYYDSTEATALVEHAREAGELRSHLRRLAGERVTITHDDPALFSPSESSAE